MKHWFTFGVALFCLCVVRVSFAQPFVLVDVGEKMVGLEGGTTWGGETVQGGFSLGVFHPRDLTQAAPDIEGYALLAWKPSPSWLLLSHLGGGVTIQDSGETASARGLFVFTGTQPVAFRGSAFVMWTPETNDLFVQPRVGPSIRLGDTSFHLFPYLAVSMSPSHAGEPLVIGASPGATVFYFW